MSQCKGWVQEDGQRRPCMKTGNSVLANGYCNSHQYIAVLKIMELLKQLEIVLTRLERDQSDPSKIRLLQQQMAMMKQELDGARKICSEDKDCSIHLKDLLASIRDITDSSGPVPSKTRTGSEHPIEQMRNMEQQISTLAAGTSFEDAQALRISKEYELARRKQIENDAKLQNVQSELYNQSSAAEQQERKFQANLQSLVEELKLTQMQKTQSQQVVDSMQKRLDRCQSESKQVSGVYSETIERLKQDLESYKTKYNEMVGREMRFGKSVDILTGNEKQLQKAIEELKQNYEMKLTQIQSKFAEQSAAANGTVLSEREEKLQQQIERLQQDLQLALNDLTLATETAKEAVTQVNNNVDKPYGQLAQELMQTNELLRQKNEELSRLQAMHDKSVQAFASAEMKVAQRIDQATVRDRNDVQRLSSELASSERKLAGLQQEISNLQTNSYELRRRHQNEVQNINNQLRDTQNQLLQLKSQREMEQRALNQQQQTLKNQQEAMKQDMDFKFNQMKENLNQTYNDKMRQLKDSMEATKLQLEQDRRNLAIAQRTAQDAAQSIEKQRQQLDNYRTAYDQKLADFYKQKQSLETAMSQAQNQSAQFSQMESDYKKRIEILRQSVAVQRQRYETQLTALKDQLNNAVAHRNQIANSLEKCSAARDSIVTKVNMLSDENTRLKDMYLQMKSRLDTTRQEYEAHLAKLRADSSRMQTDIRQCAQRLQDATLVHDHVVRMKEEAQALRNNLQEQVRLAKGNEQALRRVLHDRELEKQQVNRLQSALQECSAQRSQTEQGLANTNTELRDVKRIHQELAGEVKEISSEYQKALQEREAVIARETLQQQVKEETLRREFEQLKMRGMTQTDQINALQKQRKVLANELANSEYERARQIQSLVDSVPSSSSSKSQVTGASSLVQQ